MGYAARSNGNDNKRKSKVKEENLKDLKWALGLNQLGTELLGVWPSENHRKSEPWHLKLRVPFMVTLLFFWVCVPQTWALVLVIDNLLLVIDNLMSNTAGFGGLVKLLFLWRNKEVMRPVVESARRDWLRAKSNWEREMMLSNASSMRMVTIVDYTLMLLSLAAFIFVPVFDVDMRLINNITDRGDRHLLVQSYYPFDYWRSPYFELTQTLQYLGATFAGLAISVPENYFGALTVHLSGQFDVLARKLERFFHGPITPDCKTRLASLVRRHAHLIAFIKSGLLLVWSSPCESSSLPDPVEDRVLLLLTLHCSMIKALERSFTYVTLAQIFSTSLILCSSGFQVVAIFGASDEQLPFLQMVALCGIIFTYMLHTLVDCAVGETLVTRSTRLIDNIYNCHWYAVDAKWARDLIPMMIASRTQKPLTAGKILPLSLATFCSILKTTAGYISMLVAVNTK